MPLHLCNHSGPFDLVLLSACPAPPHQAATAVRGKGQRGRRGTALLSSCFREVRCRDGRHGLCLVAGVTEGLGQDGERGQSLREASSGWAAPGRSEEQAHLHRELNRCDLGAFLAAETRAPGECSCQISALLSGTKGFRGLASIAKDRLGQRDPFRGAPAVVLGLGAPPEGLKTAAIHGSFSAPSPPGTDRLQLRMSGWDWRGSLLVFGQRGRQELLPSSPHLEGGAARCWPAHAGA